MVAMDRENEKRQKCKQSGDDDEEVETRRGAFTNGESLLSLVQPEMKTLSKQWLAALKDHALLSLPSGKDSMESISDSLNLTVSLIFMINLSFLIVFNSNMFILDLSVCVRARACTCLRVRVYGRDGWNTLTDLAKKLNRCGYVFKEYFPAV